MPRHEQVDVVVVGAGFAGVYALHRLRRLGLSVVVIEAGAGVGGTWFWNRYPGARCDVESVDYSYSFSDELQQDWTWTERYATQPEILRYIEHVCDRFELWPDIRLNCRVQSAHYLEDTRLWEVSTDSGRPLLARYCVMASGSLSAHNFPDIPGLDAFQGELVHSARWSRFQHNGVKGRRVGIIGTGSSGIQLIPELAREAERLIVFQRTANFCMPARNEPLPPDRLQQVKDTYPVRRQRSRTSHIGVPLEVPTQSALEVCAEDRLRAFEEGWRKGGAHGVVQQFYDVSVDERANELAAEFVREKIRSIVTDRETAEKLIPRGYPIGSKRICVGSDYYETFNRRNVTLVDLQQTPIREITASGIRTDEASHPLDVLVFATGFDAMTGALLAIDIVGRCGIKLEQAWKDGPRTYLGVGVAGFPNMFCVCGPQSPSVTSNMVVSIEQHVDWIADCIDWLDSHAVVAIEPSTAAQDDWVEHVRLVAAKTLLPRANSWYLGANIPGKPRVFMPYLGGVGAFRDKCDAVAAADYRGFELDTASTASRK